MDNKIKKTLYYNMLRMRRVEEYIAKEYSKQQMRCPVHLSVGQEAVAAGISINLNKKDKIFSAHRSHFHYLAKGGDLKSMISELHGKKTGCAGGKGGSMHLIDVNAGVLAAVPLVGSTIPIGVGLAWSNKINKSKDLVVIYFGEGATEEGVFYESLNFASLHKLKILFVCENNFYSVYSSLKNRQPKERNLISIVQSMGIKSSLIDGNNIEKVYKNSKNIIKIINKSNQPYLIELKTYRHLEHCGPNNDDQLNYRPIKDIKHWLDKCPIENYKKHLLSKKILLKKDIEFFEEKIIKEIKASFDFARKSDFPNKNELFDNIYA